MNKYLRNILVYIITISLVLILYKLFIVNTYFADKINTSYFIIDFSLKLSLFAVTVYLIKKNSFEFKKLNNNKIVTGLIIIFLAYLSYKNVLSKGLEYGIIISYKNLFFYSLTNIFTGFFEEFFFRILIFGLVYKLISPKNLFLCTIITSLIFSLVHLENIFLSSYNISDVLFQIIAAFGIGLFFQLLVINAKNIYFVGFLHALVNFNGMLKKNFFNVSKVQEVSTGFDYETLIILSILLIVSLLIAYFNLKNKKTLNFI